MLEKFGVEKPHQMITQPNSKIISKHTMIIRQKKRIMNANQDNSKSLEILKSPLPKCKQIGSPLSTYS